MERYRVPVILGLAHSVSDGAAGLLFGGLAHRMPPMQVGVLVLIYNVLAFGGQPVAGLLTDATKRPRAAALAGLALMTAALLLLVPQPTMAIVLAGCGSAAFHVGGGALSVCATRGRASGAGIFAAPGVAGLAFGGLLAANGLVAVWPFLLLLAITGIAVSTLDLPALPYAPRHDEPLFDTHDLIMLVLLTAISLRSAVWNVFELLNQGQYGILMALGLAAATGKVGGGFLADRFGWRRWTVGALLIAAPLLAFGGTRPAFLLTGVALLQSATPVALAAATRQLPRYPATAAGLVLGLALAVGGLPLLGGLGPLLARPPVILLTLAAAALAYACSLPVGRQRAQKGIPPL